MSKKIRKKKQITIPIDRRNAAISQWIYDKDQAIFDKFVARSKYAHSINDVVHHIFSKRFINDNYSVEVKCLAVAFFKNADGEAGVYLRLRWAF